MKLFKLAPQKDNLIILGLHQLLILLELQFLFIILFFQPLDFRFTCNGLGGIFNFSLIGIESFGNLAG